MRLLPLPLLFLTLLSIGCGPAAPSYTPEELTKVLGQLESKTTAILDAFDTNDLMTADKVMHDIAPLYKSANAVVAGVLDQPTALKVQKAIKQHLDAMGELHAPLHLPELPEDFELGPIREKALAAIAAIRAALPEELAGQLESAVAEEAAHDADGEDHGEEHEGHDHDDESHGDEADEDTQTTE